MSAKTKPKSIAAVPSQPTFDDFSIAVMNAAANATEGAGNLMVLFQSVRELLKTNPDLAQQLAVVGIYMADGFENEMLEFQDRAEKAWKEGSAS